MSERKNYNSIVFLTTLSVYLGLVLVGGATPSVLAQAATTRDFNIKNEIVVEDDLDKKPDDNCDEGREIDIAGVLVDFVNDLKSLRKNKPYDFKQEKSFYLRRERFVYPDNSLAVFSFEEDSSDFDKSLISVLER